MRFAVRPCAADEPAHARGGLRKAVYQPIDVRLVARQERGVDRDLAFGVGMLQGIEDG